MFSKGDSILKWGLDFPPLTTSLRNYYAVQFGKKIPVLGLLKLTKCGNQAG